MFYCGSKSNNLLNIFGVVIEIILSQQIRLTAQIKVVDIAVLLIPIAKPYVVAIGDSPIRLCPYNPVLRVPAMQSLADLNLYISLHVDSLATYRAP